MLKRWHYGLHQQSKREISTQSWLRIANIRMIRRNFLSRVQKKVTEECLAVADSADTPKSESDVPNQSSSEQSAKKVESVDSEAGQFPRRAGLSNLYLAIKHINDASTADSVKQRFSDYVTIVLVIMCILSLVMAVSVQVSPVLKLLPLLFTVGSVVFYIINRLGIMISLTARQALIVWQILVAGFWLGVTSAMLVMLACFYFVSQGSGGF
jgi:hypothetical protein